MPFKKGESGNPKGKPKGTISKIPAQIKESIAVFLKDVANDTALNSLYTSLMPEDKARFVVALTKIVVPPTPNISMNIDFEDLSEEQVLQIIESMPEKKLDKLVSKIIELNNNKQ